MNHARRAVGMCPITPIFGYPTDEAPVAVAANWPGGAGLHPDRAGLGWLLAAASAVLWLRKYPGRAIGRRHPETRRGRPLDVLGLAGLAVVPREVGDTPVGRGVLEWVRASW